MGLRVWDYVYGTTQWDYVYGTTCMGLRVWDYVYGTTQWEYVHVSAMRKTNARGRHDPTASRPPSVHERPRCTEYDRESHSIYKARSSPGRVRARAAEDGG